MKNILNGTFLFLKDKKIKNRLNHYLIVIIIICIAVSSCKNAVDVPAPQTSLVTQVVFNNDATAQAALTGMFQTLAGNSLNGSGTAGASDFTSYAGLSSDEFQLYPGASSADLKQYYTNSVTSITANPFWGDIYKVVYLANNAIQALNTSNGLTPAVKQQLLGEAEFTRAFCDFYLVNIYGNIPNLTSPDYTVNENVSRTPVNQVYQQIMADLQDAQTKLSVGFLSSLGVSTTQRTIPNKTAATALLARVYLYYANLTGNGSYYAKADSAATAVIANTGNSSLLSNLNSVFLANSNEALWQMPPVQTNFDTADGYAYILPSGPNAATNPIYLSQQILNAFEPGDNRLSDWVGNYNQQYFYANKYKVVTSATPTEYTMVLRVAEQYLIRAEARVQEGNLSGATSDLNAIRNRAGLPNTTAITTGDLATAIIHENQVEFFAEYGHRWLDLKRTGQVGPVMTIVTPLKGGGSWQNMQQLMPIPPSEIQLDHNLIQNPGYN